MTGDADLPAGARRRRWLPWAGIAVALAVLAWTLWRLDLAAFRKVLATADLRLLALVPLSIGLEQWVRAWKWRQILHPLRPIGSWRLFEAIMAGYFANLLVPLGISPIVRSWLAARLEGLSMSAVLATAAIDRMVDGLVFAGVAALVVIFAAFPDPTGGIRLGLMAGGGSSLVLFALLLIGLARYRRWSRDPHGWMAARIDRLPPRFAGRAKVLMQSFALGIVWPREAWRRVGIVLAAIVMKLIAATHFLWAGLAYGVVLAPTDYLFLVVFLGFLIVVTRFARIPGGFFVGAVFALDLLRVPKEPALAMVLAVQIATMLAITAVGAPTLWRHGIDLRELRSAGGTAGRS